MSGRFENAWVSNVVRWLVTMGGVFVLGGLASAEITQCATNRTVFTGSNCTATLEDLTGEVVSSDPTAVETVTQSPPVGAELGLGDHLITLVVTYTNAPTASCTALVMVVDGTAPQITCPGDLTVTNDAGQCGAVVSYAIGATDNCGVVSTNQVAGSPSGAFFPVGRTTNTFEVADAAGHTASCSFVVTVNDFEPPAAVTRNLIRSLSGMGQLTITAAEVDNGSSDNCLITNRSVWPDTWNCLIGDQTVTLTVMDASGNSAQQSATVTISRPPYGPQLHPWSGTNYVILANPRTGTNTMATLRVGQNAGDSRAQSVVLGIPAGFHFGEPAGVAAGTQVGVGRAVTSTNRFVLRTTGTPNEWEVYDLGYDNVAMWVHVVPDTTVTVEQNPMTTPGCLEVFTWDWEMDIYGSLPEGTIIQTASTCGDYTFPLTFTSYFGDVTNRTSIVTLLDGSAPVVLACATNLTLSAGTNCTGLVPDLTGQVTASDCSPYTVTQNPSAGAELGLGTNPVTLTVTDSNGWSSSCVALLTVLDRTPPVLTVTGDKTVECTAAWAFDDPQAADACGTNTLTVLDTVTNGTGAGTYVAQRVWQAVDAFGNSATGTQVVSVVDTAAPVILFCPTNRSVTLDTNCFLALPDFREELVAADPCSEVFVSQSLLPGAEVGPGDYIVTFTVQDAASNASTCALVLSVRSPAGANTNITISEFLAKNLLGVVDDYGIHSDWVEIHNAGSCPLSLKGWSLTDDETRLTKWVFPATNIAAGQFLVVWLSDKNIRVPGKPLHANFKLADEGDYLALVQPDGVTIASQFYPTFPPQLPDISYGLPSNAPTNSYLAWPTPGLPNSPATNFFVADLVFHQHRGWFTNSLTVSIRTTTPGVTIYYTTNGTVPSPTNGLIYIDRLTLTHTTVLRAAAYRAGYVPAVQTHTYIFPDQVLFQTGAGFPTNWAGYTIPGPIPAIYGMSSNLVNDPQWSNLIHAALLSVPTLSIVMDTDDMFGVTNGIYSNPFGEGVAWERPCSVEYFRPDGLPGFQINCGIRLQGELSCDPAFTPKHNFRLLFKQMYGAGRLVHDLYPGSPVREFDTLVLHASFNDHWVWAMNRAQFQRDQWCADTQEETGGCGTHGLYLQLYINGLYWGMYNLGERPDNSYAAHYLGGEKSNYDTFNAGALDDGTNTTWNQMLALASAGITNATSYASLTNCLDVPTFIDYLLINFYGGNLDWPIHNYRAAGNFKKGVPFHFFSWDAEMTFADVAKNLTAIGTNDGVPGVLYASLRQYPEFRRLFGDHAQRLLFAHGALTPDICVARWMRRAQEIHPAIVAEAARWGDIGWTGTNFFTRNDWLQEQTNLLANWFPQRTGILIAQLRAAGLLPTLDAPVFNPHGGIVSGSLDVTISTLAAATLYYTTNGSDPRLPDGSVSPDALAYDQAVPLTLTLTASTQLRARAFATNAWSALTAADYPHKDTVDLNISGIKHRDNGAVQLDFTVLPGITYTLQACTNLHSSTDSPTNAAAWQAVATVVPNADGTFTFVDFAATNCPMRYYRLVWP